MKSREEIKKILEHDPLAEAAKVVGESTLQALPGIGFVAAMESNRRKMKTMQEIDDTHFGQSYPKFIERLKFHGFEEIYQEKIKRSDIEEQTYFFVFIHRQDKVLVVFDTYTQQHVDSCKFYFTWKPNSIKDQHIYKVGCSGSWYDKDGEHGGRSKAPNEDLIFVGDFDGREGAFFHLRELKAGGTFIDNPTSRIRDFWLIHHGDNHAMQAKGLDGYDDKSRKTYDKIIEERFAKLPADVQAMLRKNK